MFEKKLRQEMSERFDGEELRTLCANLGLSYQDDLIGQTKDARILSLIQLMQKQNKMAFLIEELNQERPFVDWDTLATGDKDNNYIIRWQDKFFILIQQNRAIQTGLVFLLIVLLGGVVWLVNKGEKPTVEMPTESELAHIPTHTSTPFLEIIPHTLTPEFIVELVGDTSTSTISPTPTVSATPTPTLSPTPTPPPSPDVIIIEFDGAVEQNILMARRIEDSLQQVLQDYNLDGINIATYPESITSIAEAQRLATEFGSKVVVWGWVDAIGVNIRIYLNDRLQARKLANVNELPLNNIDDFSNELALLARDTIPNNISFISLFVIGQLYYQNNEYVKGFEAFNAAMANLPETVVFTNEALLHFFTARQLDYGGSNDFEAIACGYNQALEADSEFVPAYVNLAIFLFNNPDMVYQECLANNNIYRHPYSLMSQAAELQPDSVLIRYNQFALDWIDGTFYTDEDMQEVQQLIADDPSISGAYVLLGSIAAMRDEWEIAIESLETATVLLPEFPDAYFNLGQLYLITGELDKAESALQQAYNLNPDEETSLALANLLIHQENFEEADLLLDEIDPTSLNSSFSSTAYVAGLLRSIIAYRLNSPEEAIIILEKLTASYQSANPEARVDTFTYYLLGILYQEIGDEALANTAFEASQTLGNLSSYYFSDVSRADKDTTLLAFNHLTFTPDEGTAEIYAILQRFTAYRLKLTPGIPLGQACPFVFTYNTVTDEWQFDTPIIINLVGADNEQVQKQRLTRFDGRLLIWELEPEISYLNHIYIIAINAQGEEFVLTHDFAPLQAADAQYHVMHRGDSQLLNFPNFANLKDITEVWVVAQGYYIPLEQ